MKHKISRRDFIKLALTSLSATFFAACKRAIEPIATVSPTGVTVTPTPRPTETLAREPTKTLAPTETPIPEFIFSKLVFNSDFSQGLKGFAHNEFMKEDGTEWSIITDPYDTGRGNVLRGEIVGDPVDQGGVIAYRSNPGVNFHTEGPVKFEEDIFVSEQLLKDAQFGDRWFGHQNVFDSSVEDGGKWSVMIRTGYSGYTGGHMRLILGNPSSPRNTNPVPGAPKFSPDKWHKMTVEVTPMNGGQIWIARLYQDGILVTEGQLPSAMRKNDKNEPVFVSYHGGPIYAGANNFEAARFQKGGFAMIDNVEIWI